MKARSKIEPRYQFDAFHAQRELRERMADFLLDTFEVRAPVLAERLRRNWTGSGAQMERLFAPMLVQGAFPFRPGKTIAELQSGSVAERNPERPLHRRTVELLHSAGMSHPLYEHQVETLRNAAAGKTVVLSAGTGSGKTEAFLIPLIDRLFWDQEHGLDDLSEPGIRAMIIYPLNALVNNQVERILDLLRGEQEISFAYYTGRLKEKRGEAENMYRHLGREVPPNCQIIDRKSLRGLGDARKGRQGPPHILVTNFSMLEYMLIRPLDHSIFHHICYKGRPRLRAIVLDEAHVYAGAQAAEIHMLLRRAALRFGTHLGDIQGYATSATLGSDDDSGTLRTFAADMFSTPADQVAAVIGRRYVPSEGSAVIKGLDALRVPYEFPAVGPLVPEDLQTIRFDESGNPVELIRDLALARKAAEACVVLGLADGGEVEELVSMAEACPAVLLHRVLSRHPRLVALRQWLFDGGEQGESKHDTRYLPEVVRRLFPEQVEDGGEAAQRATYAVLQLGSLARLEAGRHPYIPTRMHLFARTPAGVWVSPRPDDASTLAWPWGTLTSQPRTDFTEDEPLLRLYLCRTCGGPLLRVWEKRDEWGDSLLMASESPGAVMRMVYPNSDTTRCLPKAWGGQAVEVLELGETASQRSMRLSRCPLCKGHDVELEDLHLPSRAALPALVDGIYPSLGEVARQPGRDPLPGGGRRMLAFSDSRQGAARLAAEVERTHDKGVNRQLLWRVLEEQSRDADGGLVTFAELCERLADHPLLLQRAEASAFEGERDDEFRTNLATVSIYEELSTPPTRGNTLESLGLVEVCYPGLDRIQVPNELHGLLSSETWRDLLATVLNDSRSRGGVNKRLSELAGKSESLRELLPYPRQGKVLVLSGTILEIEVNSEALDESQNDQRIPLLPQIRPEAGRMRNFVTRLCERHGLGVEAERVLRSVWDSLERLARDTEGRKWLKEIPLGEEQGLQIELKKLKFKAHVDGPPFVEPVTGRVYFHNVKGVSPERNSPHELREMTEAEREWWARRHAVRRVREHALLGLWSVEHTAQLEVDVLEEQERAFKRGERNFMSSSTTMEMGVDLGGLTMVLLANVPPGPANYWQRGGRAGRRADGSSLVLTLAQPRPHDQRVFMDPRAFLERPIVPPQVRLDTRALLLRHVNAYLLAEFYRAVVVPTKHGNPMRAFGNVGEFMLHEVAEYMDREVASDLIELLAIERQETPADVFQRWLDIVSLDKSIAAVVSQCLVAGTCLATEPFEYLARASKAALEHALARARRESDVLKQQYQAEFERGEGKRDESYLRLLKRQRKVLESEALLSYLVRNDFLPRFGFPVEVVRLDTTWEAPAKDGRDVHPDEDGRALRMERSLDLALSDYAPGGEVIAKKRVHRVAGLERNWLEEEAGLAMNRYFSECNACHYVTFGDAAEPGECAACAHPTESEQAFLARRARSIGKKGLEDDANIPSESAPLPSPVRRYLVPVGFAVKLGRKPRRVAGKIERKPAPRVTIGPAHTMPTEVIAGALVMGFTPRSPLFIRSEGDFARSPRRTSIIQSGYGYRICKWCGLAVPENDWKNSPKEYAGHELLRGSRRCPHGRLWWDHAVLGIQQSVDAYRVRLVGDLAPAMGGGVLESFYLSLAVCMQQVAAEMLEIDPRTLQPAVAAYWDDDGQTGTEAVLHDGSGSGLLAHLDEAPLELMRKVCELLETQDVAAFVQFDNQYLVEQGVLQIPWLRRHLVEDVSRREVLRRGSALFEKEEATPLRGRTPRMAVQKLVDDDLQTLALQATVVDETAFEPGQVLRAVWARVIRGEHGTGRVRLLVGEVPELRRDPAQVLLASRMAQLIEHGVEVRCMPTASKTPLEEDCWSVLAHSPRGLVAIGGMSARGGVLQPWTGPAFGHAWLKDGIAVENKSQATAELAWEQFEERWAHAKPVSGDGLRPCVDEQQWVLVIHQGDSSPLATDIATILQERTGLGSLTALGKVVSLTYHDRYVARSAVAMWTLDRLLSLFAYSDGARGEILCVEPRSDVVSIDKSAEQVLKARTPPSDLDRATAMKFRDWCEQRSKARSLLLRFTHRRTGTIGHQRKLEVSFEPGGQISRMVVLFDHGLDWMGPIDGKDARPWTMQKMRAEASHIVVLVEP